MKTLVAMSGGVDSSVCALLLKQQGDDCIGVTMRLRDDTDGCGSAQDIGDARTIAALLGMDFFCTDFCREFKETVIGNFIRTYEGGGTPNPCIECNRHMKFGKLLDEAAAHGCDRIATGHYAQIEKDRTTGRYLLKKAADQTKDQSYVLWTLTQEQLSHTVFPLGSYTKAEVRAIAAANGFSNAHKHDSQDICFVPDGDYAGFIERTTGKTYPAGKFVDEVGTVLGEHRGLLHYTVGQRKGLHIALGKPMFVCDLCPADNTVVLTEGGALFHNTLTATGINLISVPEIREPMRVTAKVRYRHTEQPATVTQLSADEIRVVFDKPQRAITRGQSVVLYDGDTVVGGGIISAVSETEQETANGT